MDSHVLPSRRRSVESFTTETKREIPQFCWRSIRSLKMIPVPYYMLELTHLFLLRVPGAPPDAPSVTTPAIRLRVS